MKAPLKTSGKKSAGRSITKNGNTARPRAQSKKAAAGSRAGQDDVCTLENSTLFQKGSGKDAEYTINDDLSHVSRKASRDEVRQWVVERTIGLTWAAEDFDADLPALPCHWLAARTPAQTRELRTFIANLGEHLGTCVFAGGDAQHLFRLRSGPFVIVTEAVNIPRARTKYGLSETLWHFHISLADYVKRRPGLSFGRSYDFEPMPKDEVAVWAERTGVAAGLPLDVKRLLWGADEADGKTKGRLIIQTSRGEEKRDVRRIYNCCGSFTEEIEETDQTRPISRADVAFVLRNLRIIPVVESNLPACFRDDFRVSSYEDGDMPAEPTDVLAA